MYTSGRPGEVSSRGFDLRGGFNSLRKLLAMLSLANAMH